MRLILGFLTLFSFGVAHAQCPDPLPDNTLCIDWEAPTQYVDGSTILPGELASFRIYWGLSAGDFDLSRSINIPNGDDTTLVTPTDSVNIPSPGPAGGDVDVFFVMTATDQDNDESTFSNQIAQTITFPDTRGEPNAPTILNVIINVVVT